MEIIISGWPATIPICQLHCALDHPQVLLGLHLQCPQLSFAAQIHNPFISVIILQTTSFWHPVTDWPIRRPYPDPWLVSWTGSTDGVGCVAIAVHEDQMLIAHWGLPLMPPNLVSCFFGSFVHVTLIWTHSSRSKCFNHLSRCFPAWVDGTITVMQVAIGYLQLGVVQLWKTSWALKCQEVGLWLTLTLRLFLHANSIKIFSLSNTSPLLYFLSSCYFRVRRPRRAWNISSISSLSSVIKLMPCFAWNCSINSSHKLSFQLLQELVWINVYFTLLHLFQVDSTGVQVDWWSPGGVHLECT